MVNSIFNQRHEQTQKNEERYWRKSWEGDRERQNRAKEYWKHHVDFLKRHANLNPKSKVLDIGCGPRGLINYLNFGERYSLDPLMDYYLQGFDMPKEIKYINGQGENIPFEDNFFDLILFTNALDHVREPGKVLTEIKRTLNKQGLLFLTTNTSPLWFKLVRAFSEIIGEKNELHFHIFTHNEIRKFLNKFDFKIIKTFNEKDDLGTFTYDYKNKEIIHLNPKHKTVRALEIIKKEGWRKMFKAFVGFALLYIFREGEPRRHSIFLAVKNGE